LKDQDYIINLIECINTWQGEGADVGQRMLLCRFKFCNKKCPWCDTTVKMRALQEAGFTIKKLQEIIDTEKTGLMITGGEPTFSNQLVQTIMMLNHLNYPVANVETNGLGLIELIKDVDPSKNVRYSYSPKLFNAADVQEARDLAITLKDNENIFIKLVVHEKDQFSIDFLKSVKNNFPSHRIFLMPLGANKDEMFKNSPHMFNVAEEFQTNISTRMHLVYDFV
jgi:organic radical activating enzyme